MNTNTNTNTDTDTIDNKSPQTSDAVQAAVAATTSTKTKNSKKVKGDKKSVKTKGDEKKTDNKRIAYGFELKFPDGQFTMRDLTHQKRGKVKYITLYMRVRKALDAGEIEVVGKKDPKSARKGRKELIYSVANAKITSATASKIDAPVAS